MSERGGRSRGVCQRTCRGLEGFDRVDRFLVRLAGPFAGVAVMAGSVGDSWVMDVAGGWPPATERRRSVYPAVVALLAVLLADLPMAAAEPPGALFPEPFRVVHHAEIDHGDGEWFVGDSIIDTYGGSWLVSERPDGGRLLIDFARRELTTITPSRGTYSTVSFAGWAEATERVRTVQGLVPAPDLDRDRAGVRRSAEGESPTSSLLVTELSSGSPSARELAMARRGSPSASTGRRTSPELPPAVTGLALASTAAADRSGATVRRLRVAAGSAGSDVDREATAVLDVWVDTSLRLTPTALDALEAFERELLAGWTPPPTADPAAAPKAARAPSPGQLLAAARRHADGAIVLRTERLLAPAEGGTRSLGDGGGHSPPNRAPAPPARSQRSGPAPGASPPAIAPRAGDGPAASAAPLGVVADVATRVERLERFPSELLEIPQGLRRVPHPLEVTARYLEDERERDAALAGLRDAGGRSAEEPR